jgi:hypothetical protein
MRGESTFGSVVAACCLAAACGDDPTSLRPVEIDLRGVAEDTARVVALWLEGADRECTDLAGRDVRDLDADARDAWNPSEPERALRLPESEAEEALLVIYTEDAAGTVTRCACRPIRWVDLERPDLVVRLLPGAC